MRWPRHPTCRPAGVSSPRGMAPESPWAWGQHRPQCQHLENGHMQSTARSRPTHGVHGARRTGRCGRDSVTLGRREGNIPVPLQATHHVSAVAGSEQEVVRPSGFLENQGAGLRGFQLKSNSTPNPNNSPGQPPPAPHSCPGTSTALALAVAGGGHTGHRLPELRGRACWRRAAGGRGSFQTRPEPAAEPAGS